eukprot:scaffold647925_cov34-Prasinocladus_malaysianus.AAC.2
MSSRPGPLRGAPQVHEDVYQVVLAAVEEMLNNKQARKVMEIWVEFVEAFLGLPQRKLPTFDDDMDEDGKFVHIF